MRRGSDGLLASFAVGRVSPEDCRKAARTVAGIALRLSEDPVGDCAVVLAALGLVEERS